MSDNDCETINAQIYSMYRVNLFQFIQRKNGDPLKVKWPMWNFKSICYIMTSKLKLLYNNFSIVICWCSMHNKSYRIALSILMKLWSTWLFTVSILIPYITASMLLGLWHMHWIGHSMVHYNNTFKLVDNVFTTAVTSLRVWKPFRLVIIYYYSKLNMLGMFRS